MILGFSDGEVESPPVAVPFSVKELEELYLSGRSARKTSSIDGSLFVPVSVVVVVADGILI